MIVVDHEDPHWAARFDRLGRTNGAATYSREIVKYQIPVWQKWLADTDAVISTCPVLVGRGIKADVVVQYLHTYSYLTPLMQAAKVSQHVAAEKVIFVSAYRALHEQLLAAGYRSIHVPMTVDYGRVRQYAGPRTHGAGEIVYFGNITSIKRRAYTFLRNACLKTGWRLVVVTDPDQEAAWRKVSTYSYGIGVGRCALEMMALGLKVVYAGQEFGGIATTLAEFECQWAANFNGRVITYDRDPLVCLRSVDLSLNPYPNANVDQATTTLALEIGRALI